MLHHHSIAQNSDKMLSRLLLIYLVLAPSMASGYSSYSTSQAITSDHGSRKMDIPARKLEVFGGGPGSGHVTVLAVNLGQADDGCGKLLNNKTYTCIV